MRNRNNTMLKKIKSDISSIWAILSKVSDEDLQSNFDNYKAVSSDDAEIIKELKESQKEIDAYASEYVSSIGVPSSKKGNPKKAKSYDSTIDSSFNNSKDINTRATRGIER